MSIRQSGATLVEPQKPTKTTQNVPSCSDRDAPTLTRDETRYRAGRQRRARRCRSADKQYSIHRRWSRTRWLDIPQPTSSSTTTLPRAVSPGPTRGERQTRHQIRRPAFQGCRRREHRIGVLYPPRNPDLPDHHAEGRAWPCARSTQNGSPERQHRMTAPGSATSRQNGIGVPRRASGPASGRSPSTVVRCGVRKGGRHRASGGRWQVGGAPGGALRTVRLIGFEPAAVSWGRAGRPDQGVGCSPSSYLVVTSSRTRGCHSNSAASA